MLRAMHMLGARERERERKVSEHNATGQLAFSYTNASLFLARLDVVRLLTHVHIHISADHMFSFNRG